MGDAGFGRDQRFRFLVSCSSELARWNLQELDRILLFHLLAMSLSDEAKEVKVRPRENLQASYHVAYQETTGRLTAGILLIYDPKHIR